jgi:hypothetical protein
MICLSAYNTSYGWKKGRESKCQFDSQPLIIRNPLDLGVCKWRITYCWKNIDKGYNFASCITSFGGLHKKLWASKVLIVPISKISRFPIWKSRGKWHLDVAPVADHREYYKGEGGGFPQVRAMVSVVNPCMPVTCLYTKNVTTMH